MAASFTEQLADRLGLSEAEARTTLQNLLDRLHQHLDERGRAAFPGLGTFAYEGETLIFTPSEALELAVNHRFGGLEDLSVPNETAADAPLPSPADDDTEGAPSQHDATDDFSQRLDFDDDDVWADEDDDDPDHPLGPLPPAEYEEAEWDVMRSGQFDDEPEADAQEDTGAEAPYEPPPYDFDTPFEDEAAAQDAPDSELDEGATEPYLFDFVEDEPATPPPPAVPPATPPAPEAREEPETFEDLLSSFELGEDEPAAAEEAPPPEPESERERAAAPPPRSRTPERSSRSSRLPVVLLVLAGLLVVIAAVWYLNRGPDTPTTTPLAERPDTTATQAPPVAVPDTTAAPAEVPPTATDEEATATEETPPPPAPEPAAEGGLDLDAGGYTWVVASTTSRDGAETAAERFQNLDVPVGVVSGTSGGRTRYRVGVGQYASQAEAEVARASLADRLPDDAWLLRLPTSR